ncbi:hypothetical protein V1226_14930 [Lachnospiraceae bacterium JLR.KK009]
MTQNSYQRQQAYIRPDISKIERAAANPSLNTLKMIADSMGMDLKIEFAPKSYYSGG